MKTYFDLPIIYDQKDLLLKAQLLSNQLPQIKVVVWPDSSELKKHLSNVKQCYFKIESKLDKNNALEIRHCVTYDYYDINNPITDVDFEFSVWNSILSLKLE